MTLHVKGERPRLTTIVSLFTTASFSGGNYVPHASADVLLTRSKIVQAVRKTEDVDIGDDEAGGYYVGWTSADEYLRYTIEVTEDGKRGDGGTLALVSRTQTRPPHVGLYRNPRLFPCVGLLSRGA